MFDPLYALSSTAYTTSAYQAKLDAARAAQRNAEAAQEFTQNLRNNRTSASRAAEQQAGAQAAQETFGRLFDARGAQTKPVDDALGKETRNLRSRGLFGDTDLSQFAADSNFELEQQLASRPAQTIAGLQAPQVSLDSAAFASLFAAARPSLNLAVDNTTSADVQSQPFQRATATLSRVYGGLDELAIDFAA